MKEKFMKPSLPQGTRDFGSETLHRRRFIIETIKEVFELYGFEPLETPAIENLDTLLGKYGDEGDKLIFKILNNGLDNPSKKEKTIAAFQNILDGKNDKNITERALKYDLTIPFARYMAMNYGKLTIPYKRYQIQPVWRADRPQKGRYREFLQCDADIAGTYSLISDAELAEIYSDVFSKLKIEADIKINSRKLLYALAEVCGNIENINAITIAIDKLEKIGIDKVKDELLTIGLSDSQILLIEKYISIEGTNEEKLDKISTLVNSSEAGKKGIEELKFILGYLKTSDKSNSKQTYIIDFTLARGLNYYTGTIYEVKAKNVEMGSIGGGGRYDNLTGLFGVPDIPGVGISFGLDRIYDVMDELNLFPEDINQSTHVLFFNLGEKESKYSFNLMQQLRRHGISCELFYENSKLDKQFKYAAKKNIAYAVIIGSNEIEQQTSVIKNLVSGEQQNVPVSQIIQFFKK
ncbi:MAG TPA: histidine--tRNA ligase [Hanamia sp.]|nr:histidine--tRNA ligase [Hanamia sp.]